MSREIIDAITGFHRKRNFAMEQRKRAHLALGAFVRMALGWRKDLPDVERKRIADEAADYIENGHGPFIDVIAASELAVAPYLKIEKDCVKQMEKLAQQLPVWASFAEPVRGFGAASLAVIVAEAGDLGDYASEAKLWKRMGLAVLDGVRQGGLTKNAGAEAWIEHGYSPQRRSKMWNIGDTLIKGNRDGKYRTAYLHRKEYELAREPEMPKIKAHRRAQRYMEKRLLRDLWRAWRRTNDDVADKPDSRLSAAA